jgi:hypothetical protein
MTARTGATATAVPTATDTARLYQEGFVAGIVGALTVALWFLVLDTLNGRPLHTPTVLGVALFRRGADLAALAAHPVALDMVLMFTWVHGLVFAGLGGVASWLLGMAERDARVGFGVLLLFVVFEFGFVAAAMVLAEPVLRVLTVPAVLVANLLAAAAMGTYFRLRHPTLRVNP